MLKESIDKLPTPFIEISCRTILGLADTKELGMSDDILNRLVKELKVHIDFFKINHRDIE
jgi:hypothetical protein